MSLKSSYPIITGVLLAGWSLSTFADVSATGDVVPDPTGGAGTVAGNVNVVGPLFVGNTGIGSVGVDGGSSLTADSVTLGQFVGSSGQLQLSGAASSLETGSLVVGRQGSGELDAASGTHLTSTFINIGREGGSGEMVFSGSGALSPAEMALVNGDNAFGGFVTAGRMAGSSGLLRLDQGAVMNIVTAPGATQPGFQTAREVGASGEIQVENGSQINVIGPDPFVMIGRRDRGELHIDNGSVAVTGTNGIGYSVVVGRQDNGDGLLSIENAGHFEARGLTGENVGLVFGRDTGTQGHLEMDSSTLEIEGNQATLWFGQNGTGSGNVKDSEITITSTGPPGPPSSRAELLLGTFGGSGHGELDVDNSKIELTGDITGISISNGRMSISNGSEVKLTRNPLSPIGSAIGVGTAPSGDALLEITGSGSLLETNGLILVSQPGFPSTGNRRMTVSDGGVVKASSVQVFDGGMIDGNGTVVVDTFDVVNLGGVIAPGQSVGELSIDGGLSFFDERCADPSCTSQEHVDSTLEIEIGGPLLGEFDQLKVSERAFFQGAVFHFSFINDFLPKTGDLFEFLTAGILAPLDLGRVSLEFEGIAPGFLADLVINDGPGGSIALLALSDAAAVPEPASMALSIMGLLILMMWSRLTRKR